MTRQLVLVHGRGHEDRDAAELKGRWIAAWQAGLDKRGLRMPIDEDDIRFPYYGDTLYDLAHGAADVAAVIVRGADAPIDEQQFVASVLDEARRQVGITDEELSRAVDAQSVERGPLNWGWVQGILSALDERLPGASAATLALVTYDVYHYLHNPGVRDEIESGVRSAVTPDRETVLVGHSLGSVVTYNMLRRDGPSLAATVPLYVTLGSPLAVSAIRRALSPLRFPAEVRRWFNAMDDRDVVPLYPLHEPHFGVDGIDNKTDVDNHTADRHGIAGYLGDADVALRIHDALVAP